MIHKVFLLFIMLCGAGCTGYKAATPVNGLSDSFFSHGDGSLVPSTDKVSLNCRGQAEFDTCIYLKNPVAQKQGRVAYADLTALLQFGVKLKCLKTTGFLESERFEVLTLHSERFSLFNRAQYKTDVSDSESFDEQLMAYYWINRAFEYLEPRLGSARIPLACSPISSTEPIPRPHKTYSRRFS